MIHDRNVTNFPFPRLSLQLSRHKCKRNTISPLSLLNKLVNAPTQLPYVIINCTLFNAIIAFPPPSLNCFVISHSVTSLGGNPLYVWRGFDNVKILIQGKSYVDEIRGKMKHFAHKYIFLALLAIFSATDRWTNKCFRYCWAYLEPWILLSTE